MKNFDFSDIYAKWLPDHLEHLQGGSLDILSDLNPKEFEHVRYSTVVSIKKPKERNNFDLNIEVIQNHLDRKRRNKLEESVSASQETNTVLSLAKFREIVMMAMEVDITSNEN